MSETPIERIRREQAETYAREAAEREAMVAAGKGLCMTCNQVYSGESDDGYGFCPACTALCSECKGFGGGGYGHGPSATLNHALLPREQWPDNFTEDPECPGLGVWSCPECGRA